MVRVLTETKIKFNFRVKVHQTSAARDWHFALLTCGDVERAPLHLTLEATEGALNMFAANTNFKSSSCPATAVPWLAAAQGDIGFWLLLLAALMSGCSAVQVVLLCRQLRAKGRKGKGRKGEADGLSGLPPPAVSGQAVGGAQPVIGRSCTQFGEEKIVDGQINANPHPEFSSALATPERSSEAALGSSV